MPVSPCVEAMLTIAPGRPRSRQCRREGGAEEEAAFEVDIDDVVPFRPGDVGRRLRQRPAGIVDQYVDGSECFSSPGDGAGDLAFGAQIERDRHDLAALQIGRIDDRLEPIRIEVGDGEIVARAAERQRGGKPEAGRSAGDQSSAG